MANSEEKKIEVGRPSVREQALKNKWTMVGIGLVVFILILVMGSRSKPQELVRQQSTTRSITMGSIEEQDWTARAQAEVRENNQQLTQMKQTNDVLTKTLTEQSALMRELKSELEAVKMAQRDNNSQWEAQFQKATAELAKRQSPQNLPDGVVPPPGMDSGGPEGFVPPPLPRTGAPPQAGVRQVPKVDQPIVISSGPRTGDGDAEARTRYVKNAYAGYLPGGSFAEGVLLHGFDAGASEQTRANPQPLLIRISTDAITPGDSKYKLQSCVAVGSGYGDLSSERAYVQVTRLTCLDSKNKLVLETKILGYLIDNDNMQGIRGEVVRRNGQIIAKGLLAGFAEGIASIGQSVAQAGATSITSPISGGTQTTTTDIDVNELARAGAFGGASNAAGQLAQQYLREAASIFPVISVAGGRKVSIAIQTGTALAWETYDGIFRKEVKPEAKS